MDHTIAGMRMQPVEARVIRCNTDLRRNGCDLPINVYGHMGMNMEVAMFKTIAGNAIDGRISWVRRSLALCDGEIGEASNSQCDHADDDEYCDALRSSGSSPLFFTPSLFLAALFLPRAVTSALLAHTFHFPFVRAFQECISINQCVAGHICNRHIVVLCEHVNKSFAKVRFNAPCTIYDSTFDNCIMMPYTLVKVSTEVTTQRKGSIPMQYILSLLPLLACPVGMGLMMWFMMRGNKQEQAPQRTDPLPASAYQTPVEATHESPRRNSPLQILFMCLNWKVVAGLAVVGVIVWAVAPQLLLGAIPLLIVAACPLSMLFMMRGMQGGGKKTATPSEQMRQLPALELTHEEQLFELQSRLSGVQAQQEAIARQISEMESPETSIISEVESVARAATKRSAPRQ